MAYSRKRVSALHKHLSLPCTRRPKLTYRGPSGGPPTPQGGFVGRMLPASTCLRVSREAWEPSHRSVTFSSRPAGALSLGTQSEHLGIWCLHLSSPTFSMASQFQQTSLGQACFGSRWPSFTFSFFQNCGGCPRASAPSPGSTALSGPALGDLLGQGCLSPWGGHPSWLCRSTSCTQHTLGSNSTPETGLLRGLFQLTVARPFPPFSYHSDQNCFDF